MRLELSAPVDCLCDFTYDFFWQHKGDRFSQSAVIPNQKSSSYTYEDLVLTLKKGEDVSIIGNVGKRLGSSLGVDLKFFGGTGKSLHTGSIIVDGDIGTRMGISMICGAIFVKGNIKEPMGNVVEVISDRAGYRKFNSITYLLTEGQDENILPPNSLEDGCLYLRDGIIRDTIAARLDSEKKVIVEGNAGMSTGILMHQGFIHVEGESGLNTGVLMRGGTVITRNTGDFAGAYMAGGSLIIKGKAKGFVGANMKGGVIFYKGDAMLPGVPVDGNDIKNLVRLLEINRVEAMMFKKYEPDARNLRESADSPAKMPP
ncbi:MAG: formylmethanofuran dehydrogenase [Candidatus Methanoperedens sp.]|nr:formylmethanofuran dehydrogenase [Candidatus Methanoperedens sp.]